MIKVSCIIPVYNVEKYLRQALDSLFNQTLSGVEIICVDDCSADGSLDILKEYSVKYLRNKDILFKIIELKENKGQGYARNLALKEASGQYIMYLDSDDWLETDAFEKAYNQISKNENDILMFGFYVYKTNGNKAVNKEKISAFKNVIDCPKINLKELNTNFLVWNVVWSQIYNREFLIKNDIKFSETREAEDQIFIVKAFLCADSVSVLNEPLYNYRVYDKNDTLRNQTLIKRAYNPEELFYSRRLAIDTVLKSGLINFINAYAVNIINVYEQRWKSDRKRFAKENERKKFDEYYFEQIHNIFLELDKKMDVKSVKNYINYSFYKDVILSKNYFKYKIASGFHKFLHSVFSVDCRTDNEGRRITLRLVGLKICRRNSDR